MPGCHGRRNRKCAIRPRLRSRWQPRRPPGSLTTWAAPTFARGRYRRRPNEFRRTCERRPQDFWPNFYEGVCAYRLGNYEEACAAFRASIALAPEAAECYYNRALAYEALGRADAALSDYSRALELDPGLAAAARTAGSSDTRPAGTARRSPTSSAPSALPRAAALGQIHYNLALAYLAAGDRSSALASGETALNLGCQEAQGLCDRLRHGS